MFARLDDDLVAGVEHDQRTIADRVAHQHFLAADEFLAQRAERRRSAGEGRRTLEDVGEGLAVGLDRQRLALARRDIDVEIARVGGDAVDRALLAPELAADHPDGDAVVVDDLGDCGARDVLVARRGHLQARGQVGP